jgi:hypothetical protein
MEELRYSCIIVNVGTRWRGMVSFTLPGCFTSKETDPDTHYVRGWGDLRAGPHTMNKRKISFPFQKSNPVPQSSSP